MHLRAEPSPANRQPSRVEQLLAAHAPLLAKLHAHAHATRWGVSPEQFQRALGRGIESRYRSADPTAKEVAAYLQSLYVEDLALACACSQGYEHAWEHFVETYRPELYAAARAMVGAAGEARARELADSLYAELFGLEEREGRRRSLFDYFHGRSKLSTWLRAVLAQRHVDALRAAQRTESLDHAPEGERGPERLPARATRIEPDRARLTVRLQQALINALAALPPRDRLHLAYYYVHERTLAEIGRILGEHEATASRHLERTRRHVRQQVEQALRAELSEEQVRECFVYVLEEWHFDLTGPLSAPAESKPDALSSGHLRAKVEQE